MYLGIDIGHSRIKAAVAYLDKESNKLVQRPLSFVGRRSIPTCLFYDRMDMDGQALSLDGVHKYRVGYEAENSFVLDPACFIQDIKKNLGSSKPLNIPSAPELTAVDCMSVLLKYVLNIASKEYPESEYERIILTVPSEFNEDRKNFMMKAAENAGIDTSKVNVVYESEAAGYYLLTETGLIKEEGKKTYVIFDYGAGTLDISLFKAENGIVRSMPSMVSVHGCSGLHIDAAIRRVLLANNKWVDDLCRSGQDDDYVYYLKKLVRTIPVEAKESLSGVLKSYKNMDAGINFTLNRQEFLEIADQYVSIACNALNKFVNNNGGWASIDGVILTGGSSKIPIVKKKIASFKKGVEIIDDSRTQGGVQLAVALGAASYLELKPSAEKLNSVASCLVKEGKYNEALEYLRWAIDEGSLLAHTMIAKMYYKRMLPSSNPYSMALAELRSAESSTRCDNEIYHLLARMYLLGQGVQRDKEKATWYYEKYTYKSFLSKILDKCLDLMGAKKSSPERYSIALKNVMDDTATEEDYAIFYEYENVKEL